MAVLFEQLLHRRLSERLPQDQEFAELRGVPPHDPFYDPGVDLVNLVQLDTQDCIGDEPGWQTLSMEIAFEMER